MNINDKFQNFNSLTAPKYSWTFLFISKTLLGEGAKNVMTLLDWYIDGITKNPTSDKKLPFGTERFVKRVKTVPERTSPV